MPIPLASDQYTWRTPVATLALIALNALAYAGMLMVKRDGDPALEQFLTQYGLSWRHFHIWQPVTYQFLHDPDSIWHVVGNMLFLWIFGTPLEARLRWWGFLLLYLSGGAAAGLMQVLTSHAQVIGASGAVTAVTGAFIVFFPRARISVWMLFSVLPMPAMLLVGIYLTLDLLGVLGAREGGVAYWAHLAGFGYGFVIALLLLATGIVRRTDMDLLFRFKQARRRAEMRALSRDSQGVSALPGGKLPARVSAPVVEPSPPEKRQPNTRLASRFVEDATAAYARGEFAIAAQSYQRALESAPNALDADQTRLMLAVIYGRKLNEPTRAREFLQAIGSNLPERLRELATTLRGEVKA